MTGTLFNLGKHQERARCISLLDDLSFEYAERMKRVIKSPERHSVLFNQAMTVRKCIHLIKGKANDQD